MKYSVLVKRVVNVRVDNIEANSQAEAIAAIDDLPYHSLIPNVENFQVDLNSFQNADGTLPTVRYIEDGEESHEFLVDEEGDDDFNRSCWYMADGVTPCDVKAGLPIRDSQPAGNPSV
jgi:hypothetical protein